MNGPEAIDIGGNWRPGERHAGVDDVHGAERERLVDVGLLAERRGREHLHLVAVAVRFAISVAAHSACV
jgi:hypothetical protein